MARCRAGLIAVPAIVAVVIAAMIVAGQPVLAASAPPGTRLALPHAHLTAAGAGLATRGAPAGAGAGLARTTAAAAGAAAARPLRVATRDLPSGIAGLSYLAVLRAAGGTAPYIWSAAGLPAGLRLSPGGVLTGYPRARGTRTVTVRARDTTGAVSVTRLRLAVPEALPGRCAARSCALLSPRPHTVTVPAFAIVSVAKSPGTGQVTGVDLRGGPRVAAGDVLALPATGAMPSGLIAVATSVHGVGLVTPQGRLTAVTVRTATPADAFSAGTVQALGRAPTADRWPTWPVIKPAAGRTGAAPAESSLVQTAPAGPALPGLRPKQGAGVLSCGRGVTARVHGLGVATSLTPSVTLAWQRKPAGLATRLSHELPGRVGGLRLFQFSLAGTIALNLGVSVSGAAHCLMTLPAVLRTVRAGSLGAVVLRLRPVLRLVTTGELDVATSVTLACAAQYRLDAGKVTRASYCTATRRPLAFSSLRGASATVTGAIGVSATLDDRVLVTGTLGTALHAGYQPGAGPGPATPVAQPTPSVEQPAAGIAWSDAGVARSDAGVARSDAGVARSDAGVARSDAAVGARLTAPLGRLWAGAPDAWVTTGRFFAAVLGTWRRAASATGPRNLAVTPAIAYPWSAAVCGYDRPTFGRDELTVTGGGFLPGEPAGVAAGWGAAPWRSGAGPDGAFSLLIPVGEVPSVLDRIFPIAATGAAGSAALSSISLDADGCVLQTSRAAGLVTVRWGGNGFDPGSVVSLAIDGAVTGTARANRLGSGGAVVRLPCPAAGGYSWQVSGLVGGRLVAATSRVRCSAHPASPRDPVFGTPVRSGAAAASLAGRLPWRPPPRPGLAVA